MLCCGGAQSRRQIPLIFERDYEELMASACSGWLVLMQGAALSSVTTAVYTRSTDSHVGILLVFRTGTEREQVASRLGCTPGDLPADGILMWEAVRGMHDSCVDFASNRSIKRSGPRLVSFSERFFNNYDELQVRLAPLQRDNNRSVREIEITIGLIDFALEYRDWDFEPSPWVLFKAAWDTGPGSENKPMPSGRRLFCSDGVGRALIHCHLMSAACNTRELTPSDFDSDDPAHLPLFQCRLLRPPHLLAQAVDGNHPVEWTVKSYCSIQ